MLDGLKLSRPLHIIGKICIAFFITTGTGGVVIAAVGTNSIRESWARLGWAGASFCASMYTVNLVLRASRMWVGTPPACRPSFRRMFLTSSLHQLVNHTMPLRLGELLFPVFGSRYLSMPIAASSRLLLQVRMQEAATLGALGFGSLLPLMVSTKHPLQWQVMGTVVAAGAVLALFRSASAGAHKFSRWVCSARSIPQRVRQLLLMAGRSTDPADKVNPARGWLISWAISLVTLTMACGVFVLSGYYVPISAVALAWTTSSLGNLLPVNAVGGFGTLEAGWAVGLALAGEATRALVSLTLAMHIISVCVLVVVGGASYLLLESQLEATRGGSDNHEG